MALLSDPRRGVVDVLAIAATTAALWWALGPLGVGIAALVGLVWALWSAVYAYGAGQLLFAVIATALGVGLTAEFLVVAQVGLAALLVAELLARWPLRTAAVAVVAFAVAAVGLAATTLLEPLWVGVAALAVVYAGAAYTLHRYELVRLGLVTEADG